MRHRVTTRAAVVAATWSVLGAAALTACDSGGNPTSAPTSSRSATSTSSSASLSASSSSSSTTEAYVPVKPEFPAAAKKQTLKSAEVFVEYFYGLLNYAYTKPEGGLIGPLGTTDCEPCRYFEDESTRLERDHRRYQSAIIEIEYLTYSTTDLSEPWISVKGHQNEVSIVEADGSLTDASPSSDFTFRVTLKWSDKGWRVQNIVNV